MAGLIPSSTPFFSSTTEPRSPTTTQDYHHVSHAPPPPPRYILPRRGAVLLSSASLLLSLSPPDPAIAFSLGISGPKEWLKEQKKKSSRFLLAPLDASRQSLRSAYRLLSATDSDLTDRDLEEFQKLLKSSARDCVPEDRNSLVDFQSKTGVEVCTFKLVVKNAASLLDSKDPLKLEAENMLNDLIRSFSSLNGLANSINIKLPSDRLKIADALVETISSLDKFEKGVKDCLEI